MMTMRFFNTRFFLFFICIGCVAQFMACEGKKKDATPAAPKSNMLNADGFVVRPQQFESIYTTSGTLLPNEEIQILPEVSGRVTNISFNEGAHIEKGQVLLKLYNEDIKAQIQKLKAQRELQVRIQARQAELLRIGGIIQEGYEKNTTQKQTINVDLAYFQAVGCQN